jgi:uncharacterized integral membrane protein
MAVFAVLNGSICEVVLIPRTGEYPGHVLSTALLVGAILAVAGLCFRRTSIKYSRRTRARRRPMDRPDRKFLVGYAEELLSS